MTLDDIAAEAFVSPCYLSRAFKRVPAADSPVTLPAENQYRQVSFAIQRSKSEYHCAGTLLAGCELFLSDLQERDRHCAIRLSPPRLARGGLIVTRSFLRLLRRKRKKVRYPGKIVYSSPHRAPLRWDTILYTVALPWMNTSLLLNPLPKGTRIRWRTRFLTPFSMPVYSKIRGPKWPASAW